MTKRSPHNLWLDRLLDANLTKGEWQLAAALHRCLIGFRKTSGHLGRDLLQERSGLTDGRNFSRARKGLVDKGLIRYESGGGRGQRSFSTFSWTMEKASLLTPFLIRETAS